MRTEINNNLYWTKEYIDSSLSGQNDVSGQTKQYVNADAVTNAMRIFLAQPQMGKVNSVAGGYLLPQIKKPMTQERQSRIEEAIRNGLTKEFSPNVKVSNLSVIADLQKRKWIISIIGYIPSLQEDFNTTLILNNN